MKEIFEQYNLTPPTTMDEWLNVCKTLKDNGITPISVDELIEQSIQMDVVVEDMSDDEEDI